MSPLTIRPAQKAALTQAFFEEWLHDELLNLFPRECAAMGEAALWRFLAEGAERAKDLGFSQDDWLQYLAMEICFGASFLEGEGSEWARQAYAGPSGGRMQRLRRASIFHLATQAEREQRESAAAVESMARPDEDEEEPDV